MAIIMKISAEDEVQAGRGIQSKLGQTQTSGASLLDVAGWAKLVPEGVTITVGIPCNMGVVKAEFMSSFIGMIAGNNCVKHLEWADSGPIHKQRENLVMAALNKGTTHLLMLDSDMVMPFNLIPGLARHQQPIVGALCFKRWPAYTATLYQGEPRQLRVMMQWPEGLVKVTATGCAAMLIDLAVFGNLDPPWFRYEEDRGGKTIGEDIGFCYRAGDADIPIYVDTTIECGHIGSMNFNSAFYSFAQLVHTIDREELEVFLASKLPKAVTLKGG